MPRVPIDRFRSAVATAFGFLGDYGFERAPALEESVSSLDTIVYRGEHVAFQLSWDVREQCLDDRVIKVVNGLLKPNIAGGYSDRVFGHLIKLHGYRGNPAGPPGNDQPSGNSVEAMAEGVAQLIRTEAQHLLADRPDSLPG